MLQIPKAQITDYAQKNKLKWREDSTNQDTKFLRNKVRLQIVPKMSAEQRALWLDLLQKIDVTNEKLDTEINHILRGGLHKGQLVVRRKWFAMLPHALAKEVLAVLLVRAGAPEIDKKTIERVSVQIKTLPAGKILQATGVDIMLTKRSARFKRR